MEYLNDEGLLIEQPDNLYKLSSDAVALGNFVQCKTNDVWRKRMASLPL